MGSLLIISRLLLSTVFVVAGVGKLADNSGSRKAIIDFGIPDFLSPFLAICLPIVELALAIALIPTFTAWWGALGSLILLLAFSVAIGVNLVQGKKPDCHCFGQMHSKPVGISTLVRNGVLAGLSVLIVGQTSNHVVQV